MENETDGLVLFLSVGAMRAASREVMIPRLAAILVAADCVSTDRRPARIALSPPRVLEVMRHAFLATTPARTTPVE